MDERSLSPDTTYEPKPDGRRFCGSVLSYYSSSCKSLHQRTSSLFEHQHPETAARIMSVDCYCEMILVSLRPLLKVAVEEGLQVIVTARLDARAAPGGMENG